MTTRRDFLVQFAAFLATASLTAHAAAAEGKRIWKVGCIGSGWYGAENLKMFGQIAPIEVIALSDPDKAALEKVAKEFKERAPNGEITVYRDYRDMLAKHTFDFVVIATPDHWHALCAIAALQAGNHVFLEKPISIDIIEGEAIVAAARKYNRIVQVNTQRRSTPHILDAKREYIDGGKLGRIAYVNTYCCFEWGRENNPDTPPPEGLDWDLWCGPAPLLPFNKGMHPGAWRMYSAFGNGISADMGVHIVDMVRFLLGLGWPKSVYSIAGLHAYANRNGDAPDTQAVTFDFEHLQMLWQLRLWGEPEDETGGPWGATLFGDQGTLRINPFFAEFKPRGGARVKHEALVEPNFETGQPGSFSTAIGPAARRHCQNFLSAIEGIATVVAPVEEAHISTACFILAQLSLDTKRALRYDPAQREFIGDPEANKHLRRPYRAPWVHPEPGSV